MISNLMIRGTQPTSFCERVPAQLQFEGKDEIEPQEVQGTMLLIAHEVDDAEEKARRALDVDCVQRRLTGAKDNKKTDKKKDERKMGDARYLHQQHSRRSASTTFTEKCLKCEGFGHLAFDCSSPPRTGDGTRSP